MSEKNSVFLVAYDELFFTDISPHFSGNWLYSGLGYRVSKHFVLQAGFARQYSYTNTATAYKDFVVTSFSFH